MSTPMSWPPFLTVLAPHNQRRQTSAMFEQHSAFKSVSRLLVEIALIVYPDGLYLQLGNLALRPSGEEKVYLSSDSIIPYDVDIEKNVLKVGAHIMRLRNMDAAVGLCNGTRLIVSQIFPNVIQG
ncbi:unnamed protein product [Brassica oleracea]